MVFGVTVALGSCIKRSVHVDNIKYLKNWQRLLDGLVTDPLLNKYHFSCPSGYFFFFWQCCILFRLGSVDAGAGTGISGLLRQHNLHG